jgi:ParB family chromosome partitioning protein
MKRKALGKGIRAIIPEQTQQQLAAEARAIPLEEIRPNPYQPRQQVEENLDSLVDSIRDKGVLQPVVVRRRRDGYELAMGERRFRAAKKAGLEVIPAIVRDASDGEMLELALVENLERENLNPIDEALAFKRLADEFDMTHDDIATRVGRDRSTVSNALRLLALPYKVRDALAARKLTAGHARALLTLPNRRAQVDMAERIVRDGLSVRAVEEICAGGKKRQKKAPTEKDVHVKELEDRLTERLGSRVQVSEPRKGRGRILIHYGSLDDLERLVGLIRGQ